MNEVLFITEAKLKQNSDILENVDTKYLRNAILKSQRIKCLPIMGSDLFSKIENLIISGDISLSANSLYKNLLDRELQQAVIAFATAEALPNISFKITTKGVMQQTSENAQPADLSTIQYFIQRYEDEGEYWLNRMRDYLQEFQTQIPEYSNPNTADERTIEPDVRKPWYNQIYLKGFPSGKAYWDYQDNRPNPNT